jgi:selenide,water dikinase
LTQYARGGGCACKIPPGELEAIVTGLTPGRSAAGAVAGELLVGAGEGDDAAVVRLADGTALVATTDFFTPVVDDPYDWGRIAAANALSDVYAMGGTPLVAVNLLGWPRGVLPLELAAEVLRGGGGGGGGAPPAATSAAGTASTTPSLATAWRSPGWSTPTGCCATTPAGPGYR